MREIFRRIGHSLPNPTAVAEASVSGITLTAVFAPGEAAVGGGEDVAEVLRIATEATRAKWVVAGDAATHTIIILTGALLATPDLAKQVSAVQQPSITRCIADISLHNTQVSSVLTRKRFLFLHSEAHGWDFSDANRSFARIVDPKTILRSNHLTHETNFQIFL